jgi:hypothetical protein
MPTVTMSVSGGGWVTRTDKILHYEFHKILANQETTNGFYSKSEAIMDELWIKDMSDRLWNCDETGLSCCNAK